MISLTTTSPGLALAGAAEEMGTAVSRATRTPKLINVLKVAIEGLPV
jgi:hypothetical protein